MSSTWANVEKGLRGHEEAVLVLRYALPEA